VRKKIPRPNGEPAVAEVVHFELDSDGGRFRAFDGRWGTDYAYEILQGPMTFDDPGPMTTAGLRAKTAI